MFLTIILIQIEHDFKTKKGYAGYTVTGEITQLQII